MKTTYDWSKAVRGKYAGKYTDRDREEHFRYAAAHDLQAWIALAVTEVQRLEVALFSYLLLADGVPLDQARARALDSIQATPGVTLSGLAAGAESAGIGLRDWRHRLNELAGEREWLIRRSGYESHAAMLDPQRRERMFCRFENIVREATSLTAEFEKALKGALRSAGLTPRQIDARCGEAAELWLAA